MSVKDSVLAALQQNREKYLSGEKLSEGLGVSRAAVWKAIKSLRQEGYRIDAATNRGYRLIEDSEEVSEERIRSFLPSRYKGNGVFVYGSTDSTNIRAREIASGDVEAADSFGGASETAGSFGGASETAGNGSTPSGTAGKDVHGTIVVARQQTAGRGRLGRGFFSPESGVYLSIIVRPDFDISKSSLVTVAAASAVAEAVDAVCGQDEKTGIKWVNDVYLNAKKICGILTEGITNFENGQIEHMITGIGVNTSTVGFPEELKKTAGAVEGDWDRSRLIAEIASRFLDYVADIDSRRFMKAYRDKSILIGEDICVYKGTYRIDPGLELDGTPARVTGISDNGGLMIVNEDGSEEILTTGEVSIRVSGARN